MPISGVYLITNLINQKKYVGQSINIAQRWKAHLRKKSCLAIYSAIQKYGKENFKFEIIYCTNDRQEMNRVESMLIKEHGSMFPNGYNLLGGGGNPSQMADYVREKIREAQLNGASHIKGKKHKPETIEKMKATRKAQGNFRKGVKQSEETKQKHRDYMLGRKASDETKALLSKVHMGNTSALGHKLSDEAKDKIRQKKLGKKHTEETKAKMRAAHLLLRERGSGNAKSYNL